MAASDGGDDAGAVGPGNSGITLSDGGDDAGSSNPGDGGTVVSDAGVNDGGVASDGGCSRHSCGDVGAQCGSIDDGCGTTIACPGSCALPRTCGGAGAANLCGIPSGCTNLCLQQTSCAGSGTTTITGIVSAPGHSTDAPHPRSGSSDSLPNALVYVPNGTVSRFTANLEFDFGVLTTAGVTVPTTDLPWGRTILIHTKRYADSTPPTGRPTRSCGPE